MSQTHNRVGFGPPAPDDEKQPVPSATEHEAVGWKFDLHDHPAVVVQLGPRRLLRADADETDLRGLKPRDLALLAAVLEHALSNVRTVQGVKPPWPPPL